MRDLRRGLRVSLPLTLSRWHRICLTKLYRLMGNLNMHILHPHYSGHVHTVLDCANGA